MNKYRSYAVMFCFFAAFVVAAGMGLKNVVIHSPTIGWVGGAVLFFVASYFAIKAIKHDTTPVN